MLNSTFTLNFRDLVIQTLPSESMYHHHCSINNEWDVQTQTTFTVKLETLNNIIDTSWKKSLLTKYNAQSFTVCPMFPIFELENLNYL